jgi:flagellar motor switch protein FliM
MAEVLSQDEIDQLLTAIEQRQDLGDDVEPDVEDYIQLKAVEDNCIYLFDPIKGTAKKISDIVYKTDFPRSIVRQIRTLKKHACRLPDV